MFFSIIQLFKNFNSIYAEYYQRSKLCMGALNDSLKVPERYEKCLRPHPQRREKTLPARTPPSGRELSTS